MNACVGRGALKPRRTDDVTPRHQHTKRQQCKQTGEIEHEGVDPVEVAREQTEAEKGSQEIGLHHHQQRPGEKQQERPEQHRVRHTTLRYLGDLPLADGFGKKAGKPQGQIIGAAERFSAPPDVTPPPESFRQQPNRDQRQQVHDNDCSVTDIPENLASCAH